MIVSVSVRLVYPCVCQEMPRWGQDRSHFPIKQIAPPSSERTSALSSAGSGGCQALLEPWRPERLPLHPTPTPASLKLESARVSHSDAAEEEIPSPRAFCKGTILRVHLAESRGRSQEIGGGSLLGDCSLEEAQAGLLGEPPVQ